MPPPPPSSSSNNVRQRTRTATTQNDGGGQRSAPPPAPDPPRVAGLAVSIHPPWPDISFAQGELFFECTLFLYSVLALFLQYLNIYKTLWWLPKSYVHTAFKFHMINPYFLSCVGLLLGVRVTKCFLDAISEAIALVASATPKCLTITWPLLEWAVVKTPLLTVISTSFLFSFNRVCHDFALDKTIFFAAPPFMYVAFFFAEIVFKYRRCKEGIRLFLSRRCSIFDAIGRFSEPYPGLLDVDAIQHFCSPSGAHIREESAILVEDIIIRIKRCVYAGISTAFFAIILPATFAPTKTAHGLPQQLLIDASWMAELFLIVSTTAFSLYAAYLLPLNYIDLLHRSAMHLGTWEPAPTVNFENPQIIDWSSDLAPAPDGVFVRHKRAIFRARAHAQCRFVAAEPGNAEHRLFYAMLSEPYRVVRSLCILQMILIVGQWWILLLSSDWQHIVSLALLLFANYLLLAKNFKDHVILSRIYEPSAEDRALVQQLRQAVTVAATQR